MKQIFLIAAILFLLTSCGNWCDPKKIRSGESNRHHDTKKFRVMWVKQYGHTCKVRYENKIRTLNVTYTNCDCKKFKVGTWINIDSL